MAKILKFGLDEVDPDVNERGEPQREGKLKATGAHVRDCEDCPGDKTWRLLAEFPTAKQGRTWVCKVCQGLKQDHELGGDDRGVGYSNYLDHLREINRQMLQVKLKYQQDMNELKEIKRELVANQYAKYGTR